MRTNKVTTQLLYEQTDRTTRLIVAAMATSWLFSALSRYFSLKTGKDWFPRSGSVMCLFGAAGAFRLINSYNKALFLPLTEHVITAEREPALELAPSKRYQRGSYFAYLTGIVGTLIWGYGDLMIRI
jgi:hypothetical protein